MDSFQCHFLRKRRPVYWISEQKTNTISVYKLARPEKHILLEHRPRGRQPVGPGPGGTHCVKVQGTTKQRAEAVPILPCAMRTAGQEVSASVLARFYAPLWSQEQRCWICGAGEKPEQGDQWRHVPGRVIFRQSLTSSQFCSALLPLSSTDPAPRKAAQSW